MNWYKKASVAKEEIVTEKDAEKDADLVEANSPSPDPVREIPKSRKETEANSDEECSECLGDGALYHDQTGEPTVCPRCGGEGKIKRR